MKLAATLAAAAVVPAPVQAQPAEQLRYARWLDLGTRVGLFVLVASFIAYAAGVTAPQVPHARLPELWSLPVDAFVLATGMPTGWGWLRLAQRGDIANLIGIALLSGCSMLCLLSLLPLYAKRGERVYLGLVLTQIAVLLLAASGLLTAGH